MKEVQLVQMRIGKFLYDHIGKIAVGYGVAVFITAAVVACAPPIPAPTRAQVAEMNSQWTDDDGGVSHINIGSDRCYRYYSQFSCVKRLP